MFSGISRGKLFTTYFFTDFRNHVEWGQGSDLLFWTKLCLWDNSSLACTPLLPSTGSECTSAPVAVSTSRCILVKISPSSKEWLFSYQSGSFWWNQVVSLTWSVQWLCWHVPLGRRREKQPKVGWVLPPLVFAHQGAYPLVISRVCAISCRKMALFYMYFWARSILPLQLFNM